MKVYIAAPFELRNDARELMHALEAKGHEVTSSWLRELDEESDKWARVDLQDIARADIFLLLNPDGWQRKGGGGRHTETGYAIALGKQIVVAGVRSNIFHYLSSIRVIERPEDF